MQHRDRYGNLISALLVPEISILQEADPPLADPDRSNPTRPRLERPLDTIRAFEAAIDGSYERRPSSRAGGYPQKAFELTQVLMSAIPDILDGPNGQNKRTSYHHGMKAS